MSVGWRSPARDNTGPPLRRQAGMERRQVAKQTADVPSAQAGDESGPVGRVLPSGKLAHG